MIKCSSYCASCLHLQEAKKQKAETEAKMKDVQKSLMSKIVT